MSQNGVQQLLTTGQNGYSDSLDVALGVPATFSFEEAAIQGGILVGQQYSRGFSQVDTHEIVHYFQPTLRSHFFTHQSVISEPGSAVWQMAPFDLIQSEYRFRASVASLPSLETVNRYCDYYGVPLDTSGYKGGLLVRGADFDIDGGAVLRIFTGDYDGLQVPRMDVISMHADPSQPVSNLTSLYTGNIASGLMSEFLLEGELGRGDHLLLIREDPAGLGVGVPQAFPGGVAVSFPPNPPGVIQASQDCTVVPPAPPSAPSLPPLPPGFWTGTSVPGCPDEYMTFDGYAYHSTQPIGKPKCFGAPATKEVEWCRSYSGGVSVELEIDAPGVDDITISGSVEISGCVTETIELDDGQGCGQCIQEFVHLYGQLTEWAYYSWFIECQGPWYAKKKKIVELETSEVCDRICD